MSGNAYSEWWPCYLDNQLSDAEQRMLGACLAQLRTGSDCADTP